MRREGGGREGMGGREGGGQKKGAEAQALSPSCLKGRNSAYGVHLSYLDMK